MSKTILVAEPNEDLRMLLILQLRNITREGLDESVILGVDNSEEVPFCLHRYRQGNGVCDIMIIAREMLGVPVGDVIKKAKDLYPAIRIVVTTTSPFRDETTRTMTEAGADVVLWKPWNVKELREALQV